MTLEQLNQLSVPGARQWFSRCCAAASWINMMVESRPFTSREQLHEYAQLHWHKMQTSDLLEAFAAHPMIGDIDSLRARFANTKTLAANEQDGARQASDETLIELKQLNQQYLKKHGFIFIICATGLSAQAMLDELRLRLHNDTATEQANAADHQLQITQLRLDKGLSTPSDLQDLP
ncbi:2-oxo-4-hydroxy-4-carboxy-5-ureidoimidazoline decarboxylase [Salinimonas sediminis]|uniref:2-oxo-4-hydroxy-4-carboxy-5-ureidoimidazoline decarboxylase n=1 Tax=Salinimonas sediminis TaxID=2303538 RepID=A0A346NKW0_9ALTE|nr:2-oxo-4-hydroxy-4-carboxy-5-ureidoimidazoline decarboxylase [Salinimonas sediminis]AXR06167.1 2-oxo-4-hydroxy-4-carboxy-5-ureidoimidazoline decarboxylase [Salinimonas sediminis]